VLLDMPIQLKIFKIFRNNGCESKVANMCVSDVISRVDAKISTNK